MVLNCILELSEHLLQTDIELKVKTISVQLLYH